MAVTATTSNFAFVQTYRGGDVIARRNTLIALDGATEIRTPYDNCLLDHAEFAAEPWAYCGAVSKVCGVACPIIQPRGLAMTIARHRTGVGIVSRFGQKRTLRHERCERSVTGPCAARCALAGERNVLYGLCCMLRHTGDQRLTQAL